MDIEQFKLYAMAITMQLEAEKFHLRVAKRLLSPEPISADERASLLTEIAKKERTHEQIEASLAQMQKVFAKMDPPA